MFQRYHRHHVKLFYIGDMMYGNYLGEKFPIIKAPLDYFLINNENSEQFLNSCKTYTEIRSVYNHSFINGLNNQDMFAGLMCLMNIELAMSRLDLKYFFDKVKALLSRFPVIDTICHIVENNQNFGHITFCIDKTKILNHSDVNKMCGIPIDMGSEHNGVSAYIQDGILTGMPGPAIYTRDIPIIPPNCYSVSLRDLHECQSTQDRTERLFLSISIELCKEGIPIPAYAEPPRTICDRIPKAPASDLKTIVDNVGRMVEGVSVSSPHLNVDKSDPSSYEDSTKARMYVKDSFRTRVSDILSILLLVRDKSRIVAPGDGIGTVWAACAHHKRFCYSSDSSKIMVDIGRSVGTLVKLEDFDTTLKEIRSDDIVILSHCVQFLSNAIARILEKTKKLIVFEHDTVYDGASLLIPLRDTFRYIRHSRGLNLRNIPIKTSLDNRLIASVPKWTDMYTEGSTYYIDDPAVLPLVEMWRFWGSKISIASPIDKYLLSYLSTLGITPSPHTQNMIGLFKRRVTLGSVHDPSGRSIGRVTSSRDVMFGNILNEDDFIAKPPLVSTHYSGPVLVSAKGHSNCSVPPIDLIYHGINHKVHYVASIAITYMHSDMTTHGEISLSAAKARHKRKVEVVVGRRGSLRSDHESASKKQKIDSIVVTIPVSYDDNTPLSVSAGDKVRSAIRESKKKANED